MRCARTTDRGAQLQRKGYSTCRRRYFSTEASPWNLREREGNCDAVGTAAEVATDVAVESEVPTGRWRVRSV